MNRNHDFKFILKHFVKIFMGEFLLVQDQGAVKLFTSWRSQEYIRGAVQKLPRPSHSQNVEASVLRFIDSTILPSTGFQDLLRYFFISPRTFFESCCIKYFSSININRGLFELDIIRMHAAICQDIFINVACWDFGGK